MMKNSFFVAFAIIVLFSSCKLLDNKQRAKIMYVRVVNTGTIPTRSYILNEPTRRKHKPTQHFFPGLQPGDTTNYLPFRKINICEKVTAVLDTIALSRPAAPYHKGCGIVTTKKVNVYIKIVAKEQTGGKYSPLIEVNYDY